MYLRSKLVGGEYEFMFSASILQAPLEIVIAPVGSPLVEKSESGAFRGIDLTNLFVQPLEQVG
jgi:hypothetical protein